MNRVKMELIPDKAKCSGCGACVQVCPKGAITMQAAEAGCLYPVIDQDRCIACGQCVQQCVYRKPEQLNAPLIAYAAVAKNDVLVQNSASGGVFAALAKHWIESGGLVAGAVMECSQEVQVFHILSNHPEDLACMQGSKYVQSDAWRCYQTVKEALKEGKPVLFSGTPCQVAAIRKLTGDPDHLTTIDLICHGVPPVKMLDDYIRLLNKRFHGKVVSFRFRDKSMKKDFTASFDVRYGKRKQRFYLRSYDLSYYNHFLEGRNYRENCYSCPFARLERIADVTIGDYWGIKQQHASDFQKGSMSETTNWSCMLVNTEKGRRLLALHSQEIELHTSQPEWVAAENHQLRHPTPVPQGRKELLECYAQGGYERVEEAFLGSAGGTVKYHLRLLKHLILNQRLVQNRRG